MSISAHDYALTFLWLDGLLCRCFLTSFYHFLWPISLVLMARCLSVPCLWGMSSQVVAVCSMDVQLFYYMQLFSFMLVSFPLARWLLSGSKSSGSGPENGGWWIIILLSSQRQPCVDHSKRDKF